MKWKSLVISATALLGFATLSAQEPSASASAETGFHHRWGHPPEFEFLQQLNLTDAQKQQVKQYFSDNKPAFKNNMANMLKAKQALDSAIEKNPSDEATIRSLSANVQTAATELSVQHAKFNAFLLTILTQDQKQTLTTLQQKRDAHIQAQINRLSQSGGS